MIIYRTDTKYVTLPQLCLHAMSRETKNTNKKLPPACVFCQTVCNFDEKLFNTGIPFFLILFQFITKSF